MQQQNLIIRRTCFDLVGIWSHDPKWHNNYKNGNDIGDGFCKYDMTTADTDNLNWKECCLIWNWWSSESSAPASLAVEVRRVRWNWSMLKAAQSILFLLTSAFNFRE